MLGSAALVVLVVGSAHAEAVTTAFEAAARSVLGGEATIQVINLEQEPSDDETVAQANGVDGVVELTWTTDGRKTFIHCYLSREQRWVDREISFGKNDGNAAREATERGRLLGYAVATMFSAESERVPAPPPSVRPPAAPVSEVVRPALAAKPQAEPNQPSLTLRCLEFSGVASSGFGGTAAGLGASAGLRAPLVGVLSARLFVAARAGSIARAQASTRDARFGGGLAIAVPFREHRFELGLRSDIFLSYFDATHFSEDDVTPDRRSRWLPGADLVGEGGFRFSGNAGVFVGLGGEAMLGNTKLYTHGQRVAVVPALRAVGEIGFRIGF